MPRRSPLHRTIAAVLVATACFAQEPSAPKPAAETFVIEGRVVDMRGEGVPAAKVHVTTWQALDIELTKTVADGDGYFRLGKVPKEGWLQVHAHADGYCAGRSYAGSAVRAVTVELQQAVTVRGTVRNGKGGPVASAIVRADPDGRSLTYVSCDARTDAEGKFVLSAVPLAPVRFSAWVPGEGLAEVVQHVAADCELTLVPNEASTTRLDVTITGLPRGTPPIGLSLLPYRNGHLTEFPPPYDRPRGDADGHWSLDLAPDLDYSISPSASGFAFAPREARVKAGKGPHTLTFVATALGDTTLACKANVRGPDDKPVVGLRFEMRAPNGGNVAEATSGDNGSLTFASPLAQGTQAVIYSRDRRWVLDQRKDGSRAVDGRSLNEHGCTVDSRQTLDLRVVPACSAHGRLLLTDGRPAALVDVELEQSSLFPRWMGIASATTDRNGNFHILGMHHLDGELRVHVDSSLGSVASVAFGLTEPGREQQLGDLRLSPPAVVEGVVRDAQQRPIPGLRVWLRDWDLARNSQASGSIKETLTDRDGRYRLLGVPIGGAWLQLLTSVDERGPFGKAVEPFEVEAGKTYTFDLQVPAK